MNTTYDETSELSSPKTNMAPTTTLAKSKKGVVVLVALCMLFFYTGRRSSSSGGGGTFTTTRMRGGGTTATTVLATAVTGTQEELGCVDHYHICSGVGRGNCCEGWECRGPIAFGTCHPYKCGKFGEWCTGFRTSNSCCAGYTCYVASLIGPFPSPPGTGRCCKNIDCE